MKRLLPGLILLCVGCNESPGIRVNDARSPEPPLDVMAVYFEVVNSTDQADTLLGGRIPGFEPLEVHNTVELQSGSMAMQPMHALAVPAGGHVQLQPGAIHGMISGFSEKPLAGTELELTLTFARAGEIVVPLRIVTYADLER